MALSKRWLACIDRPTPSELSEPLRVRIVGWVFGAGAAEAVTAVDVLHDGRLVGSTRLIHDRATA